jgi:hypothetical protein
VTEILQTWQQPWLLQLLKLMLQLQWMSEGLLRGAAEVHDAGWAEGPGR